MYSLSGHCAEPLIFLVQGDSLLFEMLFKSDLDHVTHLISMLMSQCLHTKEIKPLVAEQCYNPMPQWYQPTPLNLAEGMLQSPSVKSFSCWDLGEPFLPWTLLFGISCCLKWGLSRLLVFWKGIKIWLLIFIILIAQSGFTEWDGKRTNLINK